MADFTELRLILGDQQNGGHSWYKSQNPEILYVMLELHQEADYTTHHIQKITAFFCSMRYFKTQLELQGHRVYYQPITHRDAQASLAFNLQKLIKKYRIRQFAYQEPDEYRLDCQLKEFAATLSIPVKVYSSEHFLTSRAEIEAATKPFLMERFYRRMRLAHEVLLDSKHQALGGRWNFDADNRQPLKELPQLRSQYKFKNNLKDVLSDIKIAGLRSMGIAEPFNWPINREQALEALNNFIKTALPHFGNYQDHMISGNPFVFHALISFSLNVKHLSPIEVIRAAENAYHNHLNRFPLAAVEGFIRQVLGWREYVRLIYWNQMPQYARLNYFNHTQALPAWFWNGQTRMNCVSQCITQSLEHAYAHHIQRLMIIGNFALLAGLSPDAVDAWYLGVYIDAIEWVEMPNTRGMSQYADGGLMATKPYISSGQYIHKMSNYCKSCFYNVKLKTGEGACPFNSLYWNFIDRHQNLLKSNMRMRIPLINWNKTAASTKAALIQQAAVYLQNLSTL